MATRTRRIHPTISFGFRVLVGLAILVVAFGMYGMLSSFRVDPKSRTPADNAYSVGTMTVSPVSLAPHWEGFGTARALRFAELSAEVAARVVQRPDRIDAGVRVDEGELIVQLETIDFEQRVLVEKERLASLTASLGQLDVERERLLERIELAKKEAAIAKREYERGTSALARGGGTESEVESRLAIWHQADRVLTSLLESLDNWPLRKSALEADIRRSEADLRIAEQNVARTTIHSPLAGFLQDVFVQKGEWVTIGAPVARVVNLSTIEVPLRLPMEAAGRVQSGARVTLRADSRNGSTWEGTIKRIAPEADATTRSVTVFVEVTQSVATDDDGAMDAASADALLLPGQFVIGRVTGSNPQARLVVPREAVEGGRIMVVRPDGDVPRAASVDVEVLFYVDEAFPSMHPTARQWAVLAVDALEDGQRVIVTNLDDVKPRQRVESVSVVGEPTR